MFNTQTQIHIDHSRRQNLELKTTWSFGLGYPAHSTSILISEKVCPHTVDRRREFGQTSIQFEEKLYHKPKGVKKWNIDNNCDCI